MGLINHVQQALINLRSTKLRSFLAVLGILVGTAAVVALMSCGQLAIEHALKQFKSLGTDLLAISVYPTAASNNAVPTQQESLSSTQWQQLAQRVSYIVKIAPYSTAYQPISFEGHVMQGAIIGADENLAHIIQIRLSQDQGHFVSFLESFEHFCVIGNGLAEQIKTITLDDPLGKQLRLGQSLYTIIGIADHWQENAFFNEDINHAVIIPLAGISLISKEAKINNAVILLQPDSPIDTVINDIKHIINAQASTLGIFTRSPKQIIASMQSQGHIFTLLLAVIGGISLGVGGIGVMNVMLVSVNERKKEIGIRKAVGAKNKDIQTLFLIESIMLALLGGFLGVILGLMITGIVAYFSGWGFYLYWLPSIAGFLVSVVTGVFFGFYPARCAARLEPIISLRSD